MIRRAVHKGSLDGSPPVLRKFTVTTGQTIASGDVVALSSNLLVIAVDAQAAGTVVGVAAESVSSSAAGAEMLVEINPNSIYEMQYDGTATPAVGNKYDLGTSAYKFDADDTTDGYFQVIGNVDTTDKKADVIINNRVFGLA